MSEGSSRAGGILLYRVACRLVRLILWPFFRAGIRFAHPWPQDSRVVVIGNHVSYLDPAYHCIFLPPRITFAIQERVSRQLWVRPFLRICEALPISPERAHSVKVLARGAAAGQAVSLFPEGRIAPNNALQWTYSGPALVARIAKATLVPVTVLGAENTPFALAPGYCRRRWFQKIHVVSGRPVSWQVFADLDAEAIPQKLYSTLLEARVEAIETVFTLRSFIDARLRSQGSGRAYWDLDGPRFTFTAVRRLRRSKVKRELGKTDWGKALLELEEARKGPTGEQGHLLHQLAHLESTLDLGHRDRVLCLPLESLGSAWKTVGVLFPLIRGATFLNPGKSLRSTADRLYRYDATWLIGSVAELQQLAAVARPHELQSVRRVLCVSGEAPHAETIETLTLALGLRPRWLHLDPAQKKAAEAAFEVKALP